MRRMEGFIVLDYIREWPAASQQLALWISEGKLKPKTTIVKGGLKKAEEALIGLFEGMNYGESKSFAIFSCSCSDVISR